MTVPRMEQGKEFHNMRMMQISPTQYINLEYLTRVEIMESRDIKYAILHFTGVESYRCTEEETEEIIPIVKDFARVFNREIGKE